MMNAQIAERLKAIYAAADAAVAAAGPRCDASGRCCRFREYGHTLFISQLEADYLVQQSPAFEGPVTDAACPYQVENLCTAREWRPLGCRVYFCDPNYQETGAAISERGVRELKSLADEFGLGWKYAPLHEFLADVKPSALDIEDSDSRRNRVSLALVE